MSFTPGQCRAARALIGWSQDQLAAASKVAKATIANFEAGRRSPYERTLVDLQRALETAGVIFTNGGEPGVKLRAQAESLDTQIADAKKQVVTDTAIANSLGSKKASPEKGMATLRRGLSEIKLRTLKGKKGGKSDR